MAGKTKKFGATVRRKHELSYWTWEISITRSPVSERLRPIQVHPGHATGRADGIDRSRLRGVLQLWQRAVDRAGVQRRRSPA